MIKNKKDLKIYMEEDRKALGIKKGQFKNLVDPIYKFEKKLRKAEYYKNCYTKWFLKPIAVLYRLHYRYYGYKLGYTIPLNVFGKGLAIVHIGTIVINSKAKIGDYCRIHCCVNIGTSAYGENEAPVIGNYVYIGPGAKLFGKITIGNHCAIGANSVVNKSFEDDGLTIAGVPAKVISKKGSYDIIKVK